MKWFKVWNGISEDKKMGGIAQKSKQPLAVVLGVWIAMLDSASSNRDRGSLSSFDVDDVAYLLDISEEAVNAIMDAMRAKGMLIDGRVANWDFRQGKDDDSKERVKAFRERQKEKKKQNQEVTKSSETECNALQPLRNDDVNDVTPLDKDKEVDKEKENTTTPLTPRKRGERLQEQNFLFDLFWQAYPKKVGKGAALKSWSKFQFTESEANAVIKSVQENSARNPQWLKDNGQFIPHPATWLNQERWNDSLELPAMPNHFLSDRGRQAVSAAELWLAQQEAQPAMPAALEMEGQGEPIEAEWLP